MTPEIRTYHDNLWLFGVFALAAVLVAAVRYSFPMLIEERANAVFYKGDFQRYFRESRSRYVWAGVWLKGIYLFGVSLVICELVLAKIHSWDYNSWQSLIMVMSGLVVYRILRVLINSIIAQLSQSDEGLLEHQVQLGLNQQITGLILLPLLLLHSFLPAEYLVYDWTLWLSAALILGFGGYAWIRGIRMALKEGVSLFYIILYLCSLEILPFVVIMRVFINQTG
jgi:hypothetical protein